MMCATGAIPGRRRWVARPAPFRGSTTESVRRVPVVPVRRSKVPARVIVQAPSHLGLRAAGVEALPEALLAAGLAERLGARRGTRLARPAFDPAIDAGTGLLNPHGLRDYAPKLADAIGAVLDQGAFPIGSNGSVAPGGSAQQDDQQQGRAKPWRWLQRQGEILAALRRAMIA